MVGFGAQRQCGLAGGFRGLAVASVVFHASDQERNPPSLHQDLAMLLQGQSLSSEVGYSAQPGASFGRYTTALLTQAIRQAAATVSCDTSSLLAEAVRRALGDTGAIVATDPGLGRILRFGTQIDTRDIRSDAGGLPGTGSALSAQAVANYIAKYATKTISAPGLPDHPVRSPAAIAALHCGQHYKRLISTCWELGKHRTPPPRPEPVDPHARLPRPLPHQVPPLLRHLTASCARPASPTAKAQRHPDGEKDPWGRDLDEHTVLVMASWHYAGTGHATTAERQLALAAAARAREHDQIAREETWTN